MADFLFDPTPIEANRDGADLCGRQFNFHKGNAVAGQQRDPIRPFDPLVNHHVGQPIDPRVELAIGQFPVAFDQRRSVGVKSGCHREKTSGRCHARLGDLRRGDIC